MILLSHLHTCVGYILHIYSPVSLSLVPLSALTVPSSPTSSPSSTFASFK